jgi:hypothetical protein
MLQAPKRVTDPTQESAAMLRGGNAEYKYWSYAGVQSLLVVGNINDLTVTGITSVIPKHSPISI